MPRLLPALTIVAATLAGSTAVWSQTASRFTLPPDRGLVTGSISEGQPSFFKLKSEAGNASIATRVLHRLPADARQLRFESETGWLELPLYVRPAQAGETAHLRLRYMNSVAVMPEGSKLTIFINDAPVLETNIEAATEPGLLEVPLAQGVLEAGYNAVRIAVQQRHRVDCSIQATNELWTQVDAAASGIVFTTTNEQVSQIDDLLGLPVDEGGATPIHVNIAPGADAAAMDRALRAAQAIAVRLDLRRPRILFARELTKAPGIEVIVGATAELRSRGMEVAPFGDSGVQVTGRIAETVRVVISGATPADIDGSIVRLAGSREPGEEKGTRAGLRALQAARGFPLNSEGSVSLRDIGFASQEFGGRVFRTEFNVVLPSDFYPADNGKATLMLNAGYAPGLLSTNEVLVIINGKIVGARRLKKSYGESMRERGIEMSLKSLQPGFNTVRIEIRTEAESDNDCNPLSLLEPGKRLVVSDQTAFTVPRIARVAHLPNVSATAATGFPLAEPGMPLTLYMPKADFTSLGAAGTLLARAAVAAGRTIPTRLSLAAPESTAGNVLIVGTATDTPPEIINRFGIPKESLPSAWIKRTAPRPGVPAAIAPGPRESRPRAGLEQDDTLTTATTDKAAGATSANVAERLEDSFGEDTLLGRASSGLASFLQRNIGYSADQLSFLNGGRAPFAVSNKARILLAQASAPQGQSGTWVLLLAQDAQSLASDTTMLVTPSVWSRLGGRVSTLDPQEAEVAVWQTTSNYYYRLEDKSLPNVTLFAAGWLSNHIVYYVLVILMICGMFGLVTRLVLNRIGTRP